VRDREKVCERERDGEKEQEKKNGVSVCVKERERERERAVVAATEMKPEIMAACHIWGKKSAPS
jgi:hypothetical protein